MRKNSLKIHFNFPSKIIKKNYFQIIGKKPEKLEERLHKFFAKKCERINQLPFTTQAYFA
jgi:hypothetical protein